MLFFLHSAWLFYLQCCPSPQSQHTQIVSFYAADLPPVYSQNPSPRDRCIREQLALKRQCHRTERGSLLLSLSGMAASCVGYQAHLSRSTGSSQGYHQKQMPTSMQCSSQNFCDGKWWRGPSLPLGLWAELAGYHLQKDIFHSWAAHYKRPCVTLSREWYNTDGVSDWIKVHWETTVLPDRFLKWKPGFAKN